MAYERCDACGSDEVYVTRESGKTCSGCGHVLEPPRASTATHRVVVTDQDGKEVLNKEVEVNLLDVEDLWQMSDLPRAQFDGQVAAFLVATEIEVCPFDCDHCRE